MEKTNKYLLQIKRRDEQGQIYVETKIVTASQLLDWIEFRDLEDYVEYQYRLIDDKTFALHKASGTSETTSYETGAHYRYITKGKPKYDEDGNVINDIDGKYFSSDH